jgi:basic membrane lipoprotein Med (substrate-binding protein (PBP1-ABC) superfamily)
MAHDVFISYSNKDKTIADAVCAKLEDEKVRCWMAPRDVPPGANFAGSIVDAIENCKVFVLIWSANTNTSEHILNELNQAFDSGITVIPFRVENVEPSKSLKYYIGRTHWLDAITPPLEKHIQTLADTIFNLLGRKMEVKPIKPPKEVVEAPAGLKKEKEGIVPRKKQPVGLFIISTFIIIAVITFFVLVNQKKSSSSSTSTNPILMTPSLALEKIKACMVIEKGVNDSFLNNSALGGLEKSRDDLGTEIKYIDNVSDYDASLQDCKEWDADVIFAVGYNFSESLSNAAKANPDVKYAGMAMVGLDLDNLWIQNVSVEQGDFLAGYLAAGMTASGKVGIFAGSLAPGTQIIMDGFAHGIDYYNLINRTEVKLVGYDPAEPELCYVTNDWNNDGPTIEMTKKILFEGGADVIFPIMGVDRCNAVLEVLKDAQQQNALNALFIGIDQDWSITNPEYSPYILASVVQHVDKFVIHVIDTILQGTWQDSVGTPLTLKDDMLTLEYGDDWEDRIDFYLKSDIRELIKNILAGDISPLPE